MDDFLNFCSIYLSNDSDLCGLCTRGSRVSSLLFDNCDIPERLEDDISSFGRFPSSFPVALIFVWGSIIFIWNRKYSTVIHRRWKRFSLDRKIIRVWVPETNPPPLTGLINRRSVIWKPYTTRKERILTFRMCCHALWRKRRQSRKRKTTKASNLKRHVARWYLIRRWMDKIRNSRFRMLMTWMEKFVYRSTVATVRIYISRVPDTSFLKMLRVLE